MANQRAVLWGIITIMLLMAGCNSNKNLDKRLNERVNLTEDVIQRYRIDEQWWAIYNDNQLNELITLGLENNVDLMKKVIDVNRALYQANLISADLVPTFSANTGGSVQKNIKQGGHSSQDFSGNVGVSYELDLWRKIANTASAEEWEYAATIQDKESARLALINNIVDVYYHLVYLNQSIDITKKSISNYQKINELVSLKYQYGKVSSLDPNQTKQAILSANNNLIDLQKQREVAEQTLRNLLNLKPTDPLPVNYPNLLTLNLSPVNLDVPLSVIANRPDLRAIEYRLERSLLRLKASEKSWYPTITLGAAVNSSSDRVRTAYDMPFAGGNVTIALPFLDWSRIRWRVKISEQEYEMMKLELGQAITTALNEISTYYGGYSKTRSILENLENKYGYDKQITTYYDLRYQQGAGELKDWLEAINTQINTEISLVSNRYQLIQYENQIYKAIAGRYIN